MKDPAMLRKSKTLSAAAALLLTTTAAVSPALAQSNNGYYAQGGYGENSPYPPYPYGDNAYSDPYYQDGGQDYGDGYYQDGYGEQGYGQDPYAQGGAYGQDAYGDGSYGYGETDDSQRELAAQAWRDRYRDVPAYGAGAQQPPYYSYEQEATYNDQHYRYEYENWRRECERQRANNQVGGLVFGAIAGGLFGNAVSGRGSRGGGTAVGAIAGGALGLALSSNLDCSDGYYANRAYYDGFHAGIPHTTYRWRNPNSGTYGALRVGDYYADPRGQRCATYSQTIWIHGRPEEARGYACQRYDGTWELLS